MTKLTRLFIWMGLCALIVGSVLRPATVYAQSNPTETTPATLAGLQVENRDGALQLQWQGSVQAASTGEAAETTTSYQGYLLPLQTLVVELPADQAAESALAAVAVQSVTSSPYAGELTLAPQVAPPALDYVPSPTNTPYIEPLLPSSPIFVMAEGVERGQRLAVLGFSPIYQDPATGQVLSVDSFAASVSGASVAASDEVNDATVNPETDTRFAPDATLAAPGPTNPLANTNAMKLMVSTVGIQQISGAELAAAGLSSPQASKLRVFYQGVELPLHIIDANSNNVLDAGDFVRFYAYAAGDAWNVKSVYWLTTGTTDGLRMTQRAVAAAAATARNTAYEVGRFQDNTIYDTTLAGADNDNWFQANLRAETTSASFDVNLPHQLPLNNALPTLMTLSITPYSIGAYDPFLAHRVQFATSGFNSTASFNAEIRGTKPFDDQELNVSLGKAADSWTITLLPETVKPKRAIMFDAIDYLMPVKLDFATGRGATIEGVDGTWRYQFTNTPTNTPGGRNLYDITNPAQPQRLTIPATANFDIQDGPTAHRYILTGSSTFFTPTIEAHKAVNLGGTGGAHTIYIAPTSLQSALQPLVDLRKSAGYKVTLVDPQAIYDSWSYGMVDAKAIRSYLRFAYGSWSPRPIATVLVGDTTWDPKNYLGVGNPNIIPPYIVNADPWIKYVPCDSCYGQLDGDDPAKDYLGEIWIGRFPVINTTELSIVVDKIVRYETDTDTRELWRSTSVQISDDDVRPNNTVDTAGPFIGSAEHVISLMPEAVRQFRNYYMAATDLSGAPSELLQLIDAFKGLFSTNSAAAMQRSIDLMNSGAGIVTYTGHANHWQWARIWDRTDDENNVNKWLFGLREVTRLNNRDMPFISMSMTCYTSQFHIPAPDHYTLDEHLFLYGGGGAISTWGPTGFSIVPAHDILQTGFHELLWKSPPLQAKLGALTAAGYKKVFESGGNLDVNKTFAFMGDPLTSARVAPVDTIFMPKLKK